MTNRLEALEAQMAQLKALIDKEKSREKVLGDLKSVAEKAGFTLEELFTPAQTAEEPKRRGRKPRDPNAVKEARDPVPPKYRKGDQTWSGRGRRPAWFTEAEAAGENTDQYLIKQDA